MPENNSIDIKSMFDEYLKKDKLSSGGIEWEEEPVNFKTFVSSPIHMNFPSLSSRQMDAMEFMFGTDEDDPKKMFENEHFMAVLAWGKGGFSKDKIITDVKTGESHTVEEWSKLGKDIFVYAYNFYKNKKVITKIKPFFKEGHGKIYKIKTKSGRIFYVDAEHKFYTDKFVYQKVRELKNGDKIGKLR